MKRVLYWVVTNLMYLILFYFAYFEQIKNAENVLIFITIFFAIASLGFYAHDTHKMLADKYKAKKSIPEELDYLYDIILIGGFVWFGHLYLALTYTFNVVSQNYGWSEAKKLVDKDDI